VDDTRGPETSSKDADRYLGRGRPVLVTGASGGIGEATVRLLVERGFIVWAAGRTLDRPQRLAAEFGDSVRPMAFDVTDQAAVDAAADRIRAAGSLYGLVHIAGEALPGPLEYLPVERFQQQLEVNLVAPFRVAQAMLPALRAGAEAYGEARIVMIGSLSGRLTLPLVGPYSASKHGLAGLCNGLRSELRHSRINVSLIEPGALATPIWRRGTDSLAAFQDRLPDRGGPYRAVIDFGVRYVRLLSSYSFSPERAARVIFHSLTSRSPSPRRVVGPDAAVAAVLVRVLPGRLVSRLTALPRWAIRGRYADWTPLRGGTDTSVPAAMTADQRPG
jgi:NAD(P)-dependent dehydrogenase (short-subunit alcohol dehydrogenase family)